ETALRSEKWIQFANRIFARAGKGDVHGSDAEHRLLEDIFEAYRRVSATGVSVCPLRTLIEGAQIEGILRGEVVPSYESCVDVLKRLQRAHPREVHFHVDRLGRPAYLKLEEKLVRAS